MPAAVTPSGVRDGDPAALAGLCAARGPSVLAYCRHVAGADAAGDAAADAFASFRAAVVATDDPADLNPEALLIGATRNAAARHAPRPPLDICAVVPLLLAARAAKTISDDDRATLEQHLQSCWSCRAPVARLEAAERAYRDPPDPLMDPAVVAAIIAAMAAAAPAGRARRRPQAANGSVPAPPPPAVERPTTELRAADVLDPDPVAAELAAGAAAAERERPAGTGGRAASLLGTLGLRQGADLRLPPRVDVPDPESELVLEAVEPPASRSRARARRGSPSRRAKPAAVPVLSPAGGRDGAGSRRARRRSGLRLPIILPVAVILLALLVALFVSGVFGGDDPASSPRVDVPADAPAQDAPADVVVVPGAGQADSEDVESSKARERARERRRREAAAARRAAAQRERAAAAPAAAPAPQPGAAPPPPPPPPPAADDGSRQVEAGRGATGAEQIPPAGDSSTVPELAPSPEPATSP